MHIRISLCTKFKLKLRILIFGPNLLKKGTSGKKQKNCSSIEVRGPIDKTILISLLLLVAATKILAMKVKHDFFKNIFFPSTMINGSSCSQMFFKIGVLKKIVIFTGKQLCWSLNAFNFIKKRFQHWCFPVNIAKFLRTALFIKQLPWLLVN